MVSWTYELLVLLYYLILSLQPLNFCHQLELDPNFSLLQVRLTRNVHGLSKPNSSVTRRKQNKTNSLFMSGSCNRGKSSRDWDQCKILDARDKN